TSLHDGIVAGTAFAEKRVAARKPAGGPLPEVPAPETARSLEVVFRPDPTIWDGRFSNNGWLQELPKPLTQLTWDNAALLSPGTAQRLGVKNEDVVLLRYEGKEARAPVWIM